MTAIYKPKEYGCAKRMRRTLKNLIPTLLIHSEAPENLWTECIFTICVAQNRVARTGQSLTPHETCTGGKPRVSHRRVFGWRVGVCVSNQIRIALDAKVPPGILVRGISQGKYRVMLENDKSIHMSRHYIIKEEVYLMRDWKNIFRDTGETLIDVDVDATRPYNASVEKCLLSIKRKLIRWGTEEKICKTLVLKMLKMTCQNSYLCRCGTNEGYHRN